MNPTFRSRIAGITVAPGASGLQVVLHGGRGRLLRVAEVAGYLGVCAANVYPLCERGELPHVRIVNSIRVRPDDLRAFVVAQRQEGERDG